MLTDGGVVPILLDMTNTNRPDDQQPLELGEFIFIPAWKVEGMVIAIAPSDVGTEQSISVLVEVKPDDPKPRWYRLEPSEYEIVG